MLFENEYLRAKLAEYAFGAYVRRAFVISVTYVFLQTAVIRCAERSDVGLEHSNASNSSVAYWVLAANGTCGHGAMRKRGLQCIKEVYYDVDELQMKIYLKIKNTVHATMKNKLKITKIQEERKKILLKSVTLIIKNKVNIPWYKGRKEVGSFTSPACFAMEATWSGSFAPSIVDRTAANIPWSKPEATPSP